MADLGHLFAADVFLGLVEEEAAHRRLVILLAADVAEQVYAGEAAADGTDCQLAELEGEDGGDGEQDPADWHSVAGHPEHS